MKEKSSNNILIIVLIICLLGIISIALVILLPRIIDSFRDISDYKYHYPLSYGSYEVGKDIPAGTYKIQSNKDEKCTIIIYEKVDDYLSFKTAYDIKDKTKMVQTLRGIWKIEIERKLNNISLEEGEFINISSDTEFIFYTNKIE